MINTIPSRGTSSTREIMTYDQFELWVSHNTVVERTFSEVFHESEWAEPKNNRGSKSNGVSKLHKARRSVVGLNEASICSSAKYGKIKDRSIILTRRK